MYNFVIYLINDEKLVFFDKYISREFILCDLNSREDFIKIDDFIIPKAEIKYVKFFEKDKEK